jgi:hypothetical protein
MIIDIHAHPVAGDLVRDPRNLRLMDREAAAGLNFGDCLSCALALDLREPLLWKGNDFGIAGVQSALE